MDESRKSGGPAPIKFPWETADVSADNPGATGVFGAVPESTGAPHLGSVTQAGLAGDPPQAPTSSDREVLQEPVVHKVVVGGTSGTAPTDILSVLRANSVAPPHAPSLPEEQDHRPTAFSEPVTGRLPASQSGPSSQPSSQGFTQLLRALGGDSPSVAPASSPGSGQPITLDTVVAPTESRTVQTETGFTSILRKLNPDQASGSPDERPGPPVAARVSPPSESVGGFTALLQGFSENGPDPSGKQRDPAPRNENPSPTYVTGPPVAQAPVVIPATPGGFTQLLSALNPEAASSIAAEPVATNPPLTSPPATYPEQTSVSRPSGSGSSFTQLLSALSGPPPKVTAYEDSRAMPLEDYSREASATRSDAFGANLLSTGSADWSQPTSLPTGPSTEPLRANASLTGLIRILDEPNREAENHSASPTAPSAPAPASAGASMFTETYRRLDERTETPSPEPPPSYSQPSRLSATQPFTGQGAGSAFPNQWSSAPVEPTPSAGPSAFTEILDMSRMREMQRSGASAPAQASPVAPSASPVSAPMPQMPANFQWPPPVPPAPVPGQAPHLGGAMQMPQFTQPAPVPQAPAPSGAPGMGKMQQYLPLLLIVIIFLLVVILVTVVFLLKH